MGWVVRLLSIADDPSDDDDMRLRKRAGVAAGYITVVAPLPLPFEAPGTPAAVPLALALSVYSMANLIVLARTRRFERFVIALIAAGPLFVLFAGAMVGGVTSGSGGLVWAFLVPGYAILALGPGRATPWFYAFVATVIVALLIDPIVHAAIAPPSYVVELLSFIPNLAVPLTIVFLLLRYTDVRRRQAEARSDALLTNAIPASIANRLKHGEDRIAEAYPDITIVFADIVGFTPWSQRTDPGRVVELLDDLFTRLDAVADAYGIEKIKTIGDAYMAAAGVPVSRPDHAAAAYAFAKAVLVEVAAWRAATGSGLSVRVGMASGSAVGGVIGRRRLFFDLWSDAVNTAARMESSGIPGRIQLAPSTYARLPEHNGFSERRVDVKGLGPMVTYLAPE